MPSNIGLHNVNRLQRSNPEENVARLNISDPNFSTLIESGDKLVLYQTKYIHV
jgi:hypothetical protein